MEPKPQIIKFKARKSRDGSMWEIIISPIQSGCEIHFGDGDDGAITFKLDASRYTPYFSH